MVSTENAYMVSFYHQLHCLRHLQVQFVQLLPNGSRDRGSAVDIFKDTDRHHAEHCFSYIRQAISCAGDTTLEGPDLFPEPGESPLRGWGVQHQCSKWDHLLHWMKDNAAT